MRATILLVILLFNTPLFALEKVSLQLKWHHQFQFAGYYAAVEQGYYRDEGLDVIIKDRNPALNNIDQVIKGEAQYGIADSVLLVYQAQKKPIVIVAPIFQHSPNVLISLESSGIDSPAKLVGKRISLYPNDACLAILAMLHETVDLSDRLELDNYTVTVSDLLITKLQIGRLNEKDERDILTLLSDLELGSEDRPGTIDVPYLAGLCASDWGLYHEVLLNLAHLRDRLDAYPLESRNRGRLAEKMAQLQQAIVDHPKSHAWRMRAKIGTHMPWHETVEEQD